MSRPPDRFVHFNKINRRTGALDRRRKMICGQAAGALSMHRLQFYLRPADARWCPRCAAILRGLPSRELRYQAARLNRLHVTERMVDGVIALALALGSALYR